MTSKSKRGFASMDPAKQREIARKGGASVPADKRSFSQDRTLAATAGDGGRRGRPSVARRPRDQAGPGARMTDGAPFVFDEGAPALAKASAAVSDLYPLLVAAAVEQMAAKGVPAEAPVVRRTILSLLVQIAASEAKDQGEEPFNVIDGIAHGLAAWFAQAGDGGAHAQSVLFAQTDGYRRRTLELAAAVRALGDVTPGGTA